MSRLILFLSFFLMYANFCVIYMYAFSVLNKLKPILKVAIIKERWGIYSFVQVKFKGKEPDLSDLVSFHSVQVRNFYLLILCLRRTKFQTIYSAIYLPKWKFWIQLSPNWQCYNSFAKLHGKNNNGSLNMTILYPSLCYDNVCYHRSLKFCLYITSIASKPKAHNVIM